MHKQWCRTRECAVIMSKHTGFYVTIDTSAAEFPTSDSCRLWGVGSALATPLLHQDPRPSEESSRRVASCTIIHWPSSVWQWRVRLHSCVHVRESDGISKH